MAKRRKRKHRRKGPEMLTIAVSPAMLRWLASTGTLKLCWSLFEYKENGTA